jgi:hypothetical protein
MDADDGFAAGGGGGVELLLLLMLVMVCCLSSDFLWRLLAKASLEVVPSFEARLGDGSIALVDPFFHCSLVLEEKLLCR